jgi:IclR family KDG regulon transcriptional repressor
MSDADTAAGADYRIDAVECAIDVIMAVAEQPGLSISEIARRVGGNRQRIFRMLRTLEGRGLLQRGANGKSYRLGYLALVVGNAANGQIDLIRLAQPLMREVGLQAEETVQLRIRDGLESICIAGWEPARYVRVQAVIGRRRPLHVGSSKVLLAYLPEPQRSALMRKPFQRFTRNTLTTAKDLARRLEEIRRDGHCISRGEVSDELVSITAPVFSADGTILAAMNIAAPALRMPQSRIDQIIPIIKNAALQLSRALGHTVQNTTTPPRKAAVPAKEMRPITKRKIM